MGRSLARRDPGVSSDIVATQSSRAALSASAGEAKRNSRANDPLEDKAGNTREDWGETGTATSSFCPGSKSPKGIFPSITTPGPSAHTRSSEPVWRRNMGV